VPACWRQPASMLADMLCFACCNQGGELEAILAATQPAQGGQKVQLGPGQTEEIAASIASGTFTFSNFDRLSMANISPGSTRLWAHLVSVYVVTAITMRVSERQVLDQSLWSTCRHPPCCDMLQLHPAWILNLHSLLPHHVAEVLYPLPPDGVAAAVVLQPRCNRAALPVPGGAAHRRTLTRHLADRHPWCAVWHLC
jgi:hypothetical protein